MQASKQLFRCYPVPEPKKRKGRDGGGELLINGFEADSDIAAEINRVGAPWAGPMLIFDCETLTGAQDGQGLRFGCFQERGWRYDWRVMDAAHKSLTREKLDTLWHEGIFYEPKNCTDEDIEVLEYYADACGLDLYTRADFVREIIYRNHWVKYSKTWSNCLREPSLVIGHNLSFDLGAVAIHSGLALKDMYGGLSLVMCGGEHEVRKPEPVEQASDELKKYLDSVDDAQSIDPQSTVEINGNTYRVLDLHKQWKRRDKKAFEHRVAIKKLGFCKCLYRGSQQQNGELINLDTGKTEPRFMEMVHFLDTQTCARALLGPGPSSMRELLRRLDVPKEFQKEHVDYHGPITFEYINYCRSDVENTWQIFKSCRELYKRHNLSTSMHKLYSEASTGKAYFKEFGIEGFNELNLNFDRVVLGCFMESYYGGQSDVRVRHMIVEIIHCDFKSQYPTVNVLMALQELLIAERIGNTAVAGGCRA